MKAFIRKSEDILLLETIDDGQYDLPGGRIAVGEYEMPLDEILKREIEEELGSDFRYKNNGPVAIFRHRRQGNTAAGKPEVRILMIGFELEYLGGEINLSEEHSSWKWLPPIQAAEILPGGQRNGMAKYLAYLKSGRAKILY